MDNVALFFLIFNLNGTSSPFLDNLMLFGAEYLIYVMIILMFFLSFKGGYQSRKALLLTLFALPIAILLIKAIHLFIIEQRPFVQFNLIPLVAEKANASFPSRHTTIAAVIALSYTNFRSKLAPLFLLLMLWVGVARVFVGVHFPIDIIGGFAVASISILLVYYLANLFKAKI